jgi:hypothetical protein
LNSSELIQVPASPSLLSTVPIKESSNSNNFFF